MMPPVAQRWHLWHDLNVEPNQSDASPGAAAVALDLALQPTKPKRRPSSNELSTFPRGITPAILFGHIRNTTHYLFDADFPLMDGQRFLKVLREHESWFAKLGQLDLSHSAYFELCVSAHWATASSFVPTDVDNQIRFKLWHPTLPLDLLFHMVEVVEEANTWSLNQVSTRFVQAPGSSEILTGQNGEWFSISAAAYGALRKRHPGRALRVFEQIQAEVHRETFVFAELKAAGDGIGALKAATLIAHNVGDLIRVMDMWNLPANDPLRIWVASAQTPDFESGNLSLALALNKQYMAIENHRHFALRKPKSLRLSPDLLLPLAPFLDDWGKLISRHPLLTEENLGSIIEALVDGWVYLENAVGYSRALAGMESAIRGGFSQMCRLVPSRIAKQLSTGKLRTQMAIPQTRFENQWNQFGLKNLKI